MGELSKALGPLIGILVTELIIVAFVGHYTDSRKRGKKGFKKKTENTSEERLPYVPKKGLMTPSERKLYAILKETLGDRYDISPQVGLSRIFDVRASGWEWKKYFNKISRKSVDFLVAEKGSSKPVLAIELDDWTHKLDRRIERDEFVERVFGAAGLGLLRMKKKDILRAQEDLKKDIFNALVDKI